MTSKLAILARRAEAAIAHPEPHVWGDGDVTYAPSMTIDPTVVLALVRVAQMAWPALADIYSATVHFMECPGCLIERSHDPECHVPILRAALTHLRKVMR